MQDKPEQIAFTIIVVRILIVEKMYQKIMHSDKYIYM